MMTGDFLFLSYGNIRIIPSSFLTEKKLIKMCRSKKKRIIKKWLKNPKHYKIVPKSEIIYDKPRNAIYCHPEIVNKIRDSLKDKNRTTLYNYNE